MIGTYRPKRRCPYLIIATFAKFRIKNSADATQRLPAVLGNGLGTQDEGPDHVHWCLHRGFCCLGLSELGSSVPSLGCDVVF